MDDATGAGDVRILEACGSLGRVLSDDGKVVHVRVQPAAGSIVSETVCVSRSALLVVSEIAGFPTALGAASL